jgi:hypothetical protein
MPARIDSGFVLPADRIAELDSQALLTLAFQNQSSSSSSSSLSQEREDDDYMMLDSKAPVRSPYRIRYSSPLIAQGGISRLCYPISFSRPTLLVTWEYGVCKGIEPPLMC